MSVEVKWKLVPVEPTDGMLELGEEARHVGSEWGRQQCVAEVWSAMLAAAPPAGEMREAADVLRRHLPSLDAAAIPTKSEVFVLCGSPAREMHDAILALLSQPQEQTDG